MKQGFRISEETYEQKIGFIEKEILRENIRKLHGDYESAT